MEEDKSIKEEKEFEIIITNGAAKQLQSLIDYFGGDEKKVVSLALELLDLVKDSNDIEFTRKGEDKKNGIKLPTNLSN